jgi:hypothetical protein
MEASADLERGRKSYRDEAWLNAFDSLARADRIEPLGAEDLERLARSAYMLGRDDDYVGGLKRAHQAYLNLGENPRAVRWRRSRSWERRPTRPMPTPISDNPRPMLRTV